MDFNQLDQQLRDDRGDFRRQTTRFEFAGVAFHGFLLQALLLKPGQRGR